MMDDLKAAFMAAIPGTVTKFLDEATDTATFPYCIASGFESQGLEYGDQIMVDVDHWTDEGVGHATALEDQCDAVRVALNEATLYKAGTFRAVIYFDSQADIVDGESDLIRRRQTYIVRAFFL